MLKSSNLAKILYQLVKWRYSERIDSQRLDGVENNFECWKYVIVDVEIPRIQDR